MKRPIIMTTAELEKPARASEGVSTFVTSNKASELECDNVRTHLVGNEGNDGKGKDGDNDGYLPCGRSQKLRQLIDYFHGFIDCKVSVAKVDIPF